MHHVEHDERVVGQTKPAAHVRRRGRGRQRMRHHMHRLVGRRRHGVADEMARHPDFVHVAEARLPIGWQTRQFPGPIADDTAPTHARAAERPERVRHERTVVMHHQRAGAGAERAARAAAQLDLAEGRAEIEGARRKARAIERGVGKPRAFPDAARGREQPGNAERKAAARHGIGPRRDHAADVEQDLPASLLRQALPQPPQGAALRRRRCRRGEGFNRHAPCFLGQASLDHASLRQRGGLPAQMAVGCRRQAPDHAEQQKEMPPVIGVDHETFQHLADEGAEGDDEVRLPRRRAPARRASRP